MINVKFNAKQFKLEATGHANTAPEGEDIVCAGVSALMGALGYSLLTCRAFLQRNASVKLDKGLGRISCKPKEQYEANVSLLYYTALSGLELIANTYPDSVTFECVEG